MLPIQAMRLRAVSGGGGGGYSYWNPADKSANAVLSDSDKVVTSNAAASSWVRSVTSKNAGKWRVQFVDLVHANTTGIGFATSASVGTFLGQSASSWALWGTYAGGSSELRLYNGGSYTAFSPHAFQAADYIDLLLDIDAGKAWWRRNGSVISGDPVAGTGAMTTFTPGSTLFLAADPFANTAAWRLRTDPAEMAGSAVSGFTDGWAA